FMLLLFSIGTAIPAAGVPFGWERSESGLLDAVLSIGLVIACALYLFAAIRPVYASRGWARVLCAAALTVGVAAIVLGYRFAVMLITLYNTDAVVDREHDGEARYPAGGRQMLQRVAAHDVHGAEDGAI